MKLLAGVVIVLALVIPGHAQAKHKYRIQCKKSSIHMTFSADGKSYVVTSAIVCKRVKVVLKGHR